MAKTHIKYPRLIALMFGIVAVIGISDSVRRNLFYTGTNGTGVTRDGDFLVEPGEDPQSTISFDEKNSPDGTTKTPGRPGYKAGSFSASELANGSLILVDDAHPYASTAKESAVSLEGISNDSYSVASADIMLNTEAAYALNQMMTDYQEATGLSDFIVVGTTSGNQIYSREFAENATGNTVDLALVGYLGIIGYDGYDEEGWVVQNCAKYGFIVRYPEGKYEITGQKYCPWHLRYVGKEHAAVMAEEGLCLEEYIDFLKGYTADEPYKYSGTAGNYEFYSVKCTGDVTEMLIPSTGIPERSGDNIDTLIVKVRR